MLLGAGLLQTRGLTAGSGWAHLIPGMIVAGAGLINVPLASLAVGVVRPERAGMASGINSTLRSVGLATGIAALGAIFATEVRKSVTHRLATSPLAAHAHAIAPGIGGSKPAGASSSVPAAARQLFATAARAGFVDGLNQILLIGAACAAVAAVASLSLIRGRDFVAQTAPGAVAAADAEVGMAGTAVGAADAKAAM